MKELKKTPKELKKNDIMNKDGETRKISLVLTGFREAFALTPTRAVFFGIAILIPVCFGYVSFLNELFNDPTTIVTELNPFLGLLVFHLVWILWIVHMFSFYSKGIIISTKYDQVVMPAFRDDSFIDFIYRIFPKRQKIKLSSIKKIHASEKEIEQKWQDSTDYKTIYELSVIGDFGSRLIKFDKRQKREEVRSALKDMASKIGIKVEDELDMI